MASKTGKKFLTSDFISPKESELRWAFIDQPGKETKGDNGESKFRLQIELVAKTDNPGCQALMAEIDDFWKANKPKGVKCKSKGYRVVQEKTGEVNDDDEPIYRDTDETAFQFWTSTHWPDGKEVKVKTYNAKGKEVDLGGKKIGNGSQGAVSGMMDVYSFSTNHGVTLYLNGVQLTKFVEFTQDAGFNNLADEADEDAFNGVESDFEGTTSDATEEAAPASRPRL